MSIKLDGTTVLSVCNLKGGVGKTTTTVQLAAEFSKNFDKKVLVIDFDGNCNTTNAISHSEKPDTYFSEMLISYFDDDIIEDMHDAICKTEFPNLFLVPAEPKSLTEASKRLPYTMNFNANTCLDDFLEQIEGEYDYIILDTPPVETSLFLNVGMHYADFTITPTGAGVDGLNGYPWILKQIDVLNRKANPRVKSLGIFLNRVHLRRGMTKMVGEDIEETYGEDGHIPIMIRDAKDVEEARIVSTPLCYYNEKCDVANDYHQLAAFILEKMEG